MAERTDGVFAWGHVRNQRRSDKTTDEAIAWLRDRPAGRPFFLWTHYWDPHDGLEQLPETCPPRQFMKPHLSRPELRELDPRQALYAVEVTYVDEQFGRLLDEVRAQELFDDTIVVVIADHGQGLGDHDWWQHRLLYQEQLHLPLILRVPGWPTGRRIADTARSIDVSPTILDALGMTVPGLEGASLRALVERPGSERRLAYAEALNRFDLNSTVTQKRPSAGNLYSLGDGTWKLIYHPDAPDESELYHLGEDPGELRNRYREDPEEARRLLAILDEWQPFRTEPFPAVGDAPSEDSLRALRELGYVGEDEDEDEDEGTE